VDKKTRRSIEASIKAHKMHAVHDPHEITAKARAAFIDNFEKKADPLGVLPPAERRRRAEHLKIAHMKWLALRSAEERSRKTGRQQ
jgi:truncated hemoglobin YjbI